MRQVTHHGRGVPSFVVVRCLSRSPGLLFKKKIHPQFVKSRVMRPDSSPQHFVPTDVRCTGCTIDPRRSSAKISLQMTTMQPRVYAALEWPQEESALERCKACPSFSRKKQRMRCRFFCNCTVSGNALRYCCGGARRKPALTTYPS